VLGGQCDMVELPALQPGPAQDRDTAFGDRTWTPARVLALLMVLALGIGMRVWRFESPGLWIDEFVSYWVIKDAGLREIVGRCLVQRANPPRVVTLDVTDCPPEQKIVRCRHTTGVPGI